MRGAVITLAQYVFMEWNLVEHTYIRIFFSEFPCFVRFIFKYMCMADTRNA